jgi:hypothetical protein
VQSAIFALLLVAAAPASQTFRAPLHLEMEKCDDLDQAVVKRVLSMELGASLVEVGGAVTSARAQCRASEVEVIVDDPVTGKATTRVLDLEGQPRDLRSRLLGLAISEAVLASWLELAVSTEPASSMKAPAATPEVRRQAADSAAKNISPDAREGSRYQYEITAGPVVRWFGSGLVVKGLAVDAVHWLPSYPSVGAGLDLDGGYGDRFITNVGRASATSITLAPRLFMRMNLGPLSAMASAGWRAGLARLSSKPESTARVGRAATVGWSGPFLALDLSVGLWHALFVRAGLEGGRVLIPARGTVEGVRVIAFDGAWLGGAILLGMKL